MCISKKLPRSVKVNTHIEALHVLLRETLLKKGFPSNSLPKTLQKKQSWKSLEKGLGKNLSPERFFPVVGINFCTSTGFKRFGALIFCYLKRALFELGEILCTFGNVFRRKRFSARGYFSSSRGGQSLHRSPYFCFIVLIASFMLKPP